MLSWEEIKKIDNRAIYEHEYSVRKSYERLLPIVDELYAIFAIYAWSKGYTDIAKSGSRKCWSDFVAENHEKSITDMIAVLDNNLCGDELKAYFNDKIRNQKEIIYYEQRK